MRDIMKGCNFVVIAVVAALALLSFAPPAEAGEGGVHWVTYEKGVEEQGSLKKPMLIFFHLPYCYRCKEMKRKVYSDPKVIKYINDHFIPVIVDMDKEKQKAQSLDINYVPTHVFVAPDGSIALREKDVISKARFEQMLRYVADQKYKTMDFETYEKSQS